MAQFIFYRILGNDLSPRHRSGQTLASLKFILKNEPVFPGVEKRWIVNRIVDAGMRNEIVRLLEKHKQEYRIIDFDRERFKSIPKSNFKARMDEIIGINAARNMALREGRQLGRWVLPFDGNCFFTDEAWSETQAACQKEPGPRYIIVPMVRVVDKASFLRMVNSSGTCREDRGLLIKIGTISEPQIIFSHDSKDEFDEDFSYGYLSKAELLFRLGVPGEWDRWDPAVKEKSLERRSDDFGSFTVAGHVWRLPSGNEYAEKDLQQRGLDRDRGIALLMLGVDCKYSWAYLKGCLRIWLDSLVRGVFKRRNK